MALTSRIRELAHRHRDLDQEIEAEQRRPSADEAILKALKRRKLKLKEEIEALRTRAPTPDGSNELTTG